MSNINYITRQIYSFNDLYDSSSFNINNNDNFDIMPEIGNNNIFEEHKETTDLLWIITKNSSFLEEENLLSKENIYFLKMSKYNNNFIDQEIQSIDDIFKNKDKLTINETKKSTNEPSLFNDIKVKEISNENNNNKKKYNTINMGRKRKGEIKEENMKSIVIHDKSKPDNMRLKFKRAFFNYLIEFINFLIKKSIKLKKKGKIKKLQSKYINTIKKDQNLHMLDLTAKEFLSRDICEKCKCISKDHNKKFINYIYNSNEISLIEVLDKTIRELMSIFCSIAIEDNIFKYFKRLNDYINSVLIEKKHESESYINKFIYQAQNYEKEYKKLDGRNENK